MQKIKNLSALSIALIIPLLIWGPFFPDLIVSLSVIFFLYYVIKNKSYFYLTSKPLIIFFAFCFYSLMLSIFVAKNTLLSLESSLFYFRIGVFACVVWYLINNNNKILNYFYYLLIISFISLVADGYYQYFFGYNIFGMPMFATRVSSFFGNELIMGSYLSRLFPLLFALFIIRENTKYEKYFISILFILIDLLIYISGERTAFFFLNLSTIFIIILIKKFQKLRLFTFIISFILIAFITFNNDNIKDRMVISTAKSISTSIFTEGHESYFRTATNMFKDQPILGHGPKMYRELCNNEKYSSGSYPCNTHPHNFYIQLLAETGIIGFFFLFSAFIYVAYCSIKQFMTVILNKKRYLTDYQVCLLSGMLITVWPFSPNGNFFNNWLAICYVMPVGFYLHSIYSEKLSKK
ncbi:O-antigen ligase family protein [Candidatus Pelagibacter sp. HIMB1593]|uniref:O-antigen ligase family protein n=1 Tax=Candidatus Pelagibacter sp. HIMB1593 TaxID=3413355 RepID=UPI003F8418A4